MDDMFEDVLVPTEEVVEMRRAQGQSERKFFPGYVLVAWNDRRDLSSGQEYAQGHRFSGAGSKPCARLVRPRRTALCNQVKEGVERPKPSYLRSWRTGACADGPFSRSTVWSRKLMKNVRA